MLSDVKKQSRRNIVRGVVSHHDAQADDISRFLDRSDSFIIVSAIIDDTNVWTHVERDEDLAIILSRRPKKKRTQRGRNVCVPALSHLQTALSYEKDALNLGPRGLIIEAPIIPLPSGNWATIHNRFCDWSLLSGHGCGPLLSHTDDSRHGELKDKLVSIPHAVMVICKDALVCNHNLVAEQERSFKELNDIHAIAGVAHRRHVLPIECQSHQSCLSAKPAVEDEPGFATFLTRIGHLLEQGRNMTKLSEAAAERILNKSLVALKKKTPFAVFTGPSDDEAFALNAP